jgi:hypothetical protein
VFRREGIDFRFKVKKCGDFSFSRVRKIAGEKAIACGNGEYILKDSNHKRKVDAKILKAINASTKLSSININKIAHDCNRYKDYFTRAVAHT